MRDTFSRVGFLITWAFCASHGVAQTPKTEYAAKYERSFVGSGKKLVDWGFIGPDAEKLVTFEAEGARITLPTGFEGTRPQVGLSTRLTMKGDLEVTAAYEILQEPTPAQAGPDQTRFTLALVLAQPRNNAATLSYRVDELLGRTFLVWRNLWDDETGKLKQWLAFIPAPPRKGRLRMCRAGATLFCYAKSNDANDFTLLSQAPFSADDVAAVRLAASTGSSRGAIDVRITDVQIRADAMTAAPSAEPPPIDGFVKPPTKKYVQEYFQSFKESTTRPVGWDFIGPDAVECTRFEPAGLRLNIPSGVSNHAVPRGLRSAFGIRGDCEVTASFEVIAEPPQEDSGAPVGTRFSTVLMKQEPKGDFASVSRTLSAKAGTVFVGYSIVTKVGSAKPIQQSKNTKAGSSKSGRLRMIRSGADIFYGGADGADGEFTFFRKYPFGDEELREVRLTVGTGSDRAPLDVRVTDFRIRADVITGMQVPPLADAEGKDGLPAQPQPSHKGLLAIGVFGSLALGLLMLFGVGAWILLKQRKARQTEPQ